MAPRTGCFGRVIRAFRDALAALRASELPIGRRNRVTELVSDLSGQSAAVRMAESVDDVAPRAAARPATPGAPIRAAGPS